MPEELGSLDRAGLRFQIGIFEEALKDDPNDTEALRFLAHAYTALDRLEDGLAMDRKLVALLPQDPRAHYNLACSLALTGRGDEAIGTLRRAMECGFDDLNLLRKDKDLDALRGDPRFVAIETELEGRRRS